MKKGFLLNQRNRASKKRTTKLDPPQLPRIVGPLYPVDIFGKDKLLLLSVLFALLFCYQPFRQMAISAPIKIAPVGLLALVIYMKRSALNDDNFEFKMSALAAAFLLHAFGDSYLHQSHDHLYQSSLLFGSGWVLYTLLTFNELPSDQRAWSALPKGTKQFIFGVCIYGIIIVSYLLSKSLPKIDEEGFWCLLLIPYAIAELGALSSSIILQEPFMIIGCSLYIFSDSLIALEPFLLTKPTDSLGWITWPSYYIAQWCLLLGALRWLQFANMSLLMGGQNVMSSSQPQSNSILDMLGFNVPAIQAEKQDQQGEKVKDEHDLEFEWDSDDDQ